MSYNKMFQVSLSTALVAALLVGCQASDKQRAQIKRGGGGGGAQQQKTEDNTFSGSAAGKAVEVASVDQIKKMYDTVAGIGLNKEILATDMDDAEYVLSLVMFDTKVTNTTKRMSIVAMVDGATVCEKTEQVELTIPANNRPMTSKPNPNNNPNNKNSNSNGKSVQITICDPSKVKVESALNSDKQFLEHVLGAAAYLRFNVKDKKIAPNEKTLSTFKAGYNNTARQLSMEVMPGQTGKAENVFYLLAGADSKVLNGKTYQLKGANNSTINATIRKLDADIISIDFEVISITKNNAGIVKNLVFEYKKVAKAASTETQGTPTAPATPVTVNTGATGGDTAQPAEATAAPTESTEK